MDHEDTRYAPREKTFDRILTPFAEFVHDETAGGILLIIATVTALILASSPLQEAYQHMLEMPIAISIGDWRLEHSLHHRVNDGLMALFAYPSADSGSGPG